MLVELLAQSLGPTTAANVVNRAANDMGVTAVEIPIAQAYGVLQRLQANPGLVGTAASLAIAQLRLLSMRQSRERGVGR